MSVLHCWKLNKYARFLEHEHAGQGDQSQGQWKFYDASRESLNLSLLSTHHLLVMHGLDIQENHMLVNSQTWMKGVSKGDSMLFVYRIKSKTRRFRVKFDNKDGISGIQQCENCVAQLANYFSIKSSEQFGDNSQGSGDSGRLADFQKDVLPISKIAELMSGQLKDTLPQAYQHTNIPVEQLNTLLRLCLADTNFPAFVGQVEKEMQKIMTETTK